MGVGSGDRLARGAAKAQFAASEGTTQEKFDQAVADFDPATYLANEEKKAEEARQRREERLVAEQAEADQIDREREERRSRTNAEEAGVSSSNS